MTSGRWWASGLLAFSGSALTLEAPFPSNPYLSFWRVAFCAARGIAIPLGIVLLGRVLVRKRQESVHCGAYLFGRAMNLTDATLVLLLAARIHGTDEAVRASAKSVVKKLPRSKRDLIYKVIDSESPLELVGFLAQNLED